MIVMLGLGALAARSIEFLLFLALGCSHGCRILATDVLLNGVGLCLRHVDLRAGLLADPRDFLRRRRNPLAGIPGKHAGEVHGVDFFKGPAWEACIVSGLVLRGRRHGLVKCAVGFFLTLTFDDEEVDDQSTHQVAGGEDVAVAEVDRTCDERCEESEQEIPAGVVSQRTVSVQRRE
jgi:hypothetical protein